MARQRLTNEQIKARLIFVVGVSLTLVFVTSILSILYGILFITQPAQMPESDKQSWSLLVPLIMSLAGMLGGLLAANGLKDKHQTPTEPPA